MKKDFTLLIADRNPHVRTFLQREMTAAGYRVRLADNGREVLKWAFQGEPLDMIILDPDLPDADETHMLEHLLDRIPMLPVIMHTYLSEYDSGYYYFTTSLESNTIARVNQGRRWVIRSTIDTRTFNDLVKNVRIGKTGEAYLLDAVGVFQTQRRSGGTLMRKDPDRSKYGPVHDDIRSFIDSDASGVPFLYATTWLKDDSWLLVVRQEKADAFKALREASYLIVLISVLGGATIVAVAFFLTGRIIRRMERMDQEKNQLGEQLIRAGRLAEIGSNPVRRKTGTCK